MGKIEYDNIEFDSQEEIDFYNWCVEAKKAGLIKNFAKCEKGIHTFELIGKQYYHKEGKKKHCFAAVTYTPDFLVYSERFKPFTEKDIDTYCHYIDVKGGFSRNHDNKQFQIIRKMMYLLEHKYIHKVIPEKLFLKTWVPEKVRYTPKTGKLRKKYEGCLTISEFKERV